jgi:hypothetical protein
MSGLREGVRETAVSWLLALAWSCAPFVIVAAWDSTSSAACFSLGSLAMLGGLGEVGGCALSWIVLALAHEITQLDVASTQGVENDISTINSSQITQTSRKRQHSKIIQAPCH